MVAYLMDGNELDSRRQFLRHLGASPAVAHALAMRTLEVPNFDLRHFQRRRYRLSVELGDCRQPEVDAVVLQSIGTLVENSEQNRIQSRLRPRTPSPPRNINWHNNREISPQQIERSRPRTRNVDDNIRGRPRGAPVPRENFQAAPMDAGPPPGRRNEIPSPGRREDVPLAPRMNVPQGRRNDAPPGRRDVPQARRNDAQPAPRMNVSQGRRDAVSPGRRDVVAFDPRDNVPPARRNDRSDAVPPANVPQSRRNDGPTGRRDAFPPGPRENVLPARRNDRSDAVLLVDRENVGRRDTVPSGPRKNVPSGRRAPAVPANPIRAAIPTVPMQSIPPRGKQTAAVGPRKTVPPVRMDPVPPVVRTQDPSEVLPPVRGNPGAPIRGKPGPLGRGKPGPNGREPVAGRGPPNQGKQNPNPGPNIRGKPGPSDRRNNIQGPADRGQFVPGREAPILPGPRQTGSPGRRDNSQGFVERIDLTQMSSHERSPPHFDGARNDSYPNIRPERNPNNRNDNFEMNNRGMDPEFCGQSDFNDPRFNHAQRGPGPDEFLVNQRQNIDHDDSDDFQRQQRGFDRPQPPAPFMGNPNTEFFDSELNFGGQQQQSRNIGGRPQIGNNYQRIFHNDQVTILRTDMVDLNERHFDRNPDNIGPNDCHFEGNFRDQEPRFNDDRDGRQFMDEERHRGQQRADNFGRPHEDQNENWGFYSRDTERSDNFDRSLERNDPQNRDVRFNLNNEPNHRDLRFNLSNDDRNAYRRDRNDRYDRNDQGFINDNCRDQMIFNDSGPGPHQSNQSRFSGDHRFENDRDFDQQQRQFDGNFNQSNNQREFDTFPDDFQPNQYQDNVDIDYQNRGDQRSLDRGNDRSGSGYRNTNAHNQERNTARNIKPDGPPSNRSNQARKAPRNAIAGGPNQNRTNSSVDRAGNAARNSNQNRTNSSADRAGNAARNSNQNRTNSSADRAGDAARNPNQNRTNSSADRAGNAARNPNPVARASGANQNKQNPSTIPAKGGKSTSAASNQAKTAKNPAHPGGPAANPEANTSMQARKMPGKPPEANPRAGQKRVAGDATKPPVGDEIKRRRVIRGKGFLIGGRKLPYVEYSQELPQAEEASYAVTFFEQKPNYNTNIYANEDGIVVEEHDGGDDDSSDSEIELPETTKGGRQYAKKRTQNRLRKEWTDLYRKQNYKDWHNWWTDYKWCGHEINKVLEKFPNRNLEHRFLPIYKNSTTEGVVRKVLQLGHVALDKNTFNVQRNMRAIFLLMNDTFLNNLKIENIEQLENLIRRVPNHLWLYKLRSMVYVWTKHQQVLKDTPSNIRKALLNSYAKKWKTPMFHWLAKQAFDELKAISEISWPDHNRFYPGIKKPLKTQMTCGKSII